MRVGKKLIYEIGAETQTLIKEDQGQDSVNLSTNEGTKCKIGG